MLNGRRGPYDRAVIFTTRIRMKNKSKIIKNRSGRFLEIKSWKMLVEFGGNRVGNRNEGIKIYESRSKTKKENREVRRGREEEKVSVGQMAIKYENIMRSPPI